MKTLVAFFRKMKNFIVKLLSMGGIICAILWEMAMIAMFIHAVGLLKIMFAIDAILIGIVIYNLIRTKIISDEIMDVFIARYLPKK